MSNFEININSILKELNLSKNNFGTSSGKDWIITSGTLRDIFSPVDGNKIGTISMQEVFQALVRYDIQHK